MTTIARPQTVRADIGVDNGNGISVVDHRTESVRVDLLIPGDPREQRRIKNQLIVLAIVGPVARLVSLLFC
jgi:hypothetical protein